MPKLSPGSSTTKACPRRGRRLLQLALISSAGLTSIGLKWRFQDSDQSRGGTLENETLGLPKPNPHFMMRANPERTKARFAADHSDLRFRYMVNLDLPVSKAV